MQASDCDTFRIAYAQPAPALRGLVSKYWEVRGSVGSARAKLLPREEVALIVNLGGPAALLTDAGAVKQRLDDAWLCGLQPRPLFVETEACNWRCGARLTPEGAFLLLGEAAAALAGEVVPVQELAPRWGRELAANVRQANTMQERFAAFDAAFGNLLEAPADRDATIAWVARAIRSGTHAGIGAIAADVGWSRQRMHERFVARLGVAPKAFARLARFEKALRALHAPKTPLASVAQGCGYFDQAHFTREFRAFAGESPAAYVRARLDFGDSAFIRQS
jgi:AraC-like DNA-binding protein